MLLVLQIQNYLKSVKKNLDSFLKSNFHGEMDWLKKNKHRRESPENLWSDVKTVISLGTNYGPDENPLENLITRITEIFLCMLEAKIIIK